MTFVFEPDLRNDWRGAGDWDDMEVPVDGRERYRLEYDRKRRVDKAERDAAKPKACGKSRAWPDEDLALLKKLWMEGKTANEVSLLLGRYSRSAVLGQVHRSGLVRSDSGETSRQSSVIRSKATYRPKRGVKPRQSIGNGKGRIADARKTPALAETRDTAEVILFRETADLFEEFDDLDGVDLMGLVGLAA